MQMISTVHDASFYKHVCSRINKDIWKTYSTHIKSGGTLLVLGTTDK